MRGNEKLRSWELELADLLFAGNVTAEPRNYFKLPMDVCVRVNESMHCEEVFSSGVNGCAI